MKLQIMSDLHLEFHPRAKHWDGVYSWQIPRTDAGIVVLAGDIGMWKPATRWAVRESQRLGKPVIYVAGNHEWYRDSMDHFAQMVETAEDSEKKVHVLDRGEIVIGNERAGASVRFLGATLWTDYALFGEGRVDAAIAAAREQMNDFRLIAFKRRPWTRFTPWIARQLHVEAPAWLKERLAWTFPGQTVVVTHHAPSNLGQHERRRNMALAPSFASELSELMDPGRVALWIHGHTHYCARHKVNGVPMVTNQAGYYRIEEVPGFDPALTVEVPA